MGSVACNCLLGLLILTVEVEGGREAGRQGSREERGWLCVVVVIVVLAL